jgi:uncharacterized protein YabE (DUF348 family)
MNDNRLRLAALALVTWGVVLIILSARKEVSLRVDEDSTTLTTYAWTVKGLIRAHGMDLIPEDRVAPHPSRWLKKGQTVEISRARPIRVSADGEHKLVTTAERKPANILRQAGIRLFPEDQILVNGEAYQPDQQIPLEDPILIQVQRGTPIRLSLDDRVLQFTSKAGTVAGALWEQQIPLYRGDQLDPGPGTPLNGKPTEINLKRSQPLEITLEDRILTTRSAAERVGEALLDAGISLQGRDYSQPGEEQGLPEDGKIQVVRVDEEIILNQEPIPFTSQLQPTPDLLLDQQQVLQPGAYGLKAQQVRVIYENGAEISREVEKEWVVKEPEPRIVGYGTDIEIRTVNTPDGPIRVWREITAYATSYNESCPGCDTITASGAVLKKGVIAVTLEWYRYMQGLQVYIPGYGFASIEDVGGGIPGKFWVDLGYRKKNYVPWHENVTVYFLAPPPPPDNIMYVLY